MNYVPQVKSQMIGSSGRGGSSLFGVAKRSMQAPPDFASTIKKNRILANSAMGLQTNATERTSAMSKPGQLGLSASLKKELADLMVSHPDTSETNKRRPDSNREY